RPTPPRSPHVPYTTLFRSHMTNFRKVLLPAPEEPTIKTNSPFSTVRLMLWRASVPLLYTFDTLRNSIKPITVLSLVGYAPGKPRLLESQSRAAQRQHPSA